VIEEEEYKPIEEITEELTQIEKTRRTVENKLKGILREVKK